jgi:hypothetical protein
MVRLHWERVLALAMCLAVDVVIGVLVLEAVI